MDGLYHKDIGFPNVKMPEGTYKLNYSRHAQRAAKDDRYGEAKQLPSHINMSQVELIEAEVINNKVNKVVVRKDYNKTLDLVIVFMPQTPDNFVKTVWFNEKIDKHKTLRRDRYNKP